MFRAGFGPTFADAADGADGIFERRAYPDYSASGSAFTTEGNVDAERPKKRLRATQVAGEGARIFGPADPVARLPGAFNTNPQKISGAPRPRAALAHELLQASGDRVRVDDAFDRGLAVGCVGTSESASGPVKPPSLDAMLGRDCVEFNAAVAKEIPVLAQAGLKGIVLASRYFGFNVTPFHRDDDDPTKLVVEAGNSGVLESQIWQQHLRQTLSIAQKADLKVLLIPPVPYFSLPVPLCLAHRSLENCSADRISIERTRFPLTQALQRTVAEFDNARIWTHSMFCAISMYAFQRGPRWFYIRTATIYRLMDHGT